MRTLLFALSVVLVTPIFAHDSQTSGAVHWLEHWLPLGLAVPLFALVLIRRLRRKDHKH